MSRAGLAFVTMLVPAMASAETCFVDNGKPPAQALTGTLRYVRPIPPFAYPSLAHRFYALDLREAACLKDEAGVVLHQGVKSIHVYATDDRGEALLKKHRDKRVAVEFGSLFPELTVHHRRPIVGSVATVRPAR